MKLLIQVFGMHRKVNYCEMYGTSEIIKNQLSKTIAESVAKAITATGQPLPIAS